MDSKMKNEEIGSKETKEFLQEKIYLMKFIEDIKTMTMNELIELESALENEKNNRFGIDI